MVQVLIHLSGPGPPVRSWSTCEVLVHPSGPGPVLLGVWLLCVQEVMTERREKLLKHLRPNHSLKKDLEPQQSPPESPRVPQSPPESPRVPQSPPESPRVPQSPPESPRVLQSPTESSRVLQSPPESSRVPQSPTDLQRDRRDLLTSTTSRPPRPSDLRDLQIAALPARGGVHRIQCRFLSCSCFAAVFLAVRSPLTHQLRPHAPHQPHLEAITQKPLPR
ncbi:uncharacterized protein V6R79_016162 [Siganus canaliculatus]